MSLSDQQKDIVAAPLVSMCVIACAGSGKTRTAVHRLAKVRADMAGHRGQVALLSFTNTAVNTFKSDYIKLLNDTPVKNNDRIVIETLDSFITTNIIRPHAHRIMKCEKTPYLITGSEEFLKNRKYLYWFESGNGDKRPVPPQQLANISFRCVDDDWDFWYREKGNLYSINNGDEATKNLGKVGAYTHELGKYWALMTLLSDEHLLRAMVNRYPNIIVDEAQDIDFLHRAFLEVLVEAGAKVTLIGDPHQAIYEFAGADGTFLNEYEYEIDFPLTKNYRSISKILTAANLISGRNDDSDRDQGHVDFGAFYIVYDRNKPRELVDNFVAKTEAMELAIEKSAVLYRSRSGIEKLSGVGSDIGQGKTKLLALASIKRDQDNNYQEAFNLVLSCLIGLLELLPDDFSKSVVSNEEYRNLKKMIWLFIRDPLKGLPSGDLAGKTDWHACMKLNVDKLLGSIEDEYGFKPCDNLGRMLAKTKLPEGPLVQADGLFKNRRCALRIDTVHQAKGESLDAVLYMPTEKKHLRELLQGTNTELGRIGYVALTRAKDFFVLGVQSTWVKDFEDDLARLGFKEQI